MYASLLVIQNVQKKTLTNFNLNLSRYEKIIYYSGIISTICKLFFFLL